GGGDRVPGVEGAGDSGRARREHAATVRPAGVRRDPSDRPGGEGAVRQRLSRNRSGRRDRRAGNARAEQAVHAQSTRRRGPRPARRAPRVRRSPKPPPKRTSCPLSRHNPAFRRKTPAPPGDSGRFVCQKNSGAEWELAFPFGPTILRTSDTGWTVKRFTGWVL